jgi:hypothetical protein
MKQFSKILIFSILAVFLLVGGAMAGPFGSEITIYDGKGSGTGWDGEQEDQETEPGMVGSQVWDLEGFFLQGTTLTMVGGFNFFAGQDNYSSGDIFISTDLNYGDATVYADGYHDVNSNYGYEYVLDMDFSAKTYSVYALDPADTIVKTAYFHQNNLSNPWTYVSGGEVVSDDYIGRDFSSYGAELTDSAVGGLEGGNHYAVSVDLGFLGTDPGFFVSHFTMQCGNDNLMGQNPVPEPATMLLFGAGLIGLAGLGRKKFRKS